MTLLAGLCSVTFRAFTCDDVVAAAERAQLDAIEWGADVHVPPGDTERASAVARRCADAGITIPSYGSYLLAAGVDLAPLAALLDTACALGAMTLRVWTPFGTVERAAVVDALAATCRAAGDRGLEVGLEFHPGTLTETAAGTMTLLDDVGASNLWTYWQPPTGHVDDTRCIAELHVVLARLAHLHVFSWDASGDRRPLAMRSALWPRVFELAGGAGEWPHPRVAYLEFVTGDSPGALTTDAATLLAWLRSDGLGG
jgi:sugar phosphate isomerase/epimerase